MSSDVYFEGKKYISAKDAARLYGYVPDYIGQLCREGKIDGKMVGRSWYVYELAIKNYRSNSTPEAKPAEIQYAQDTRPLMPILSSRVSKSPEPETISAPKIVSPLSKEFAEKVLALALASSMVISLYTAGDPTYGAKLHDDLVKGGTTMVKDLSAAGAAIASIHSLDDLALLAKDSLSANIFTGIWGKVKTYLADLFSTAPVTQLTQNITPPASQTVVIPAYPEKTSAPSATVEKITERYIVGDISRAEVDQKFATLNAQLQSQISTIATFANQNYGSLDKFVSHPAPTYFSNISIDNPTVGSLSGTFTDISGNRLVVESATTTNFYAQHASFGDTNLASLILGNFDGPLQANHGTLSATTSIGVYYGGTGLTTAPSYGQVLLGNTLGGYDLTGTSSLGFITSNILEGTNLYYTDARVNSFIHASSTIPKTYSQNIFNALNIFSDVIATNSTTTNATSTNFYASYARFGDLALTGSAIFPGLIATNSTTTNATSTNFFASIASSTNLFSQNATIGTLALGSLSSSGLAVFSQGFISQASSTATGNFEVVGSLGIGTSTPSQNLSVAGNGYFTGGVGVGISTTTPGVLETAGDTYVGGNLTVIGNSTTLGGSFSNTLTVNSSINSNLIPDVNATHDIGSNAYYWNNGYFANITANNITANSTSIGGTDASAFTINSDNVSSDGEDSSIVFYRGTVVPNATITWNHANKRLEFNSPGFFQNASTTSNVISLDVLGGSGQTADIFRVASSTGASYLSVTNAGRIGIGTTTPASALDIYATDAIHIPVGTSAQRPSMSLTGQVRYNTDTHQFEGFSDSNTWQGLGGVVDADQTTYITADTNNINEDYLRFFTNSLQRLTITNTGLIGIGTTSPSQALSVEGNALISGNISAANITATGTVTAANLSLSGSTTLSNFTAVNATTTNATSTNLFATVASSTNLYSSVANVTTLVNSLLTGVSATFSGTLSVTGLTTLGNASTTQITSTGSAYLATLGGNVGIGTTSPSQALSVEGNALISGNISAANITATGTVTAANLSLSGSTTLSNFTAVNATTTNATSTNLFATVASSTNLYSSVANVTTLVNSLLTGVSATFSGTLSVTGLTTLGNASTTQITSTGSAYLATLGGNVGIGTTSPSQALSVAGNALISGNISAANITATGTVTAANLSLSGSTTLSNFTAVNATTTNATSTNLFATVASSTNLYSSVANVTTLVNSLLTGVSATFSGTLSVTGLTTLGNASTTQITSTGSAYLATLGGNVGIGTTSPWAQLSINPSGVAGPEFAIGSSTKTHFIVTNGGFVGIGTTSPVAPLAVSSFVNDAIVAQFGSVNANQTVNFVGGNTGSANPIFSLQFQNLDDYMYQSAMIRSRNETGVNTGDLEFLINNGVDATADEAMRINNVGNVGINSTTPYSRLQVTGTGTGGGQTFGVVNSASTTLMQVLDNGNVGIGTTAPSQKLHVNAATGNIFTLLQTGDNSRAQYIAQNNTESAYFGIESTAAATFTGTLADAALFGSNGAHAAQIITNSNARLTVDSTGNVGIGTTGPSSQLHVVTSAAGQSLRLTDNTNSTFIVDHPSTGRVRFNTGSASQGYQFDMQSVTGALTILATSGNVGIGTATPGVNLDIYKASATVTARVLSDSGNTAQLDLNQNGVRAWHLQNVATTGALNFNDGSVNALTILNTSGNVGIGTTTPAQALSVAGSVFVGASAAGGTSGGLGVGIVDTSAGELAITGAAHFYAGANTTYQTMFSTSVGSSEVRGYNNSLTLFGQNGGVFVKTTDQSNVTIPSSASILTVSPNGSLTSNISPGDSTATALLSVGGTWNPSQFSGDIRGINLSYAINQTGSASQNYIGYFQNVTETAALGTNNRLADWQVGGVSKFLVSSSGKVGIGTSTPVFGETIYAGTSGFPTNSGGAVGAGVLRLTPGSVGSSMDFGIDSASPGGSSGTGWIQMEHANSLSSHYSLALNPNGGNVGIGTTTPDAKLNLLSAVSATPITNAIMRITGTGSNPATGSGGGLVFAQESSIAGNYVNYASITGRRVNNAANNAIDLDFNTGDPTDSVALATRMTIMSGGNVGIGTTSPSYLLSMSTFIHDGQSNGIYVNNTNNSMDARSVLALNNGGGYTGQLSVFNGPGDATPTMFLGTPSSDMVAIKLNTGNVGIATTSPAYSLDIGGVAGQIRLDGTSSGNGGGMIFTSKSVYQGFIGQQDVSGYSKSNFSVGSVASIPLVLGTNNAERVRIDTSGNVGIGTTNPSQALSLGNARNLSFQNSLGGTGTYGAIYSYNALVDLTTPATAIRFLRDVATIGPDGAIAMDTDNAERLRITSTGNVGIGTTTPQLPFVVSGGSGTGVDIAAFTGTGTGGNRQLRVYKNNVGNGGISIQSQDIGEAQDVNASSRNLDLNPGGGNVGIGTTSPGTTLSVNGGGYFTGGLTAVLPAIGANTGQIVLMKSGGALTTDTTQLTWDSANDTMSVNGLQLTSTSVRSSNSDNLQLGSANTFPSITVLGSTGNVGIGTTAPDYRLDVGTKSSTQTTTAGALGLIRNNAAADTGPYTQARIIVYGGTNVDASNWGYLGYGSDAVMRIVYGKGPSGGGLSIGQSTAMDGTGSYTNRMFIDGSGNVGIGNTSPTAKLHVGAGVESNSASAGLITGARSLFSSTAGLYTGQLAAYDTTSMASGVGGAISFLGNYTGTTPTWFASIAGIKENGTDANYAGALVFNTRTNGSSAAERMRIDSAGNVGIGTTSPYAMLSVAGLTVAQNFYATSTTATSTFAGGLVVGNNAIVYDSSSLATTINNLQTGNSSFADDSGAVLWTDMNVTSAQSSGTVESYTAALGGNGVLTVYGESDGAGSTQNRRIGIATSTPWRTLDVNGTVGFKGLGTGTGGNYLCIDTTTNEILRGNGSACTASSQRFKDNITDLTYGLTSILALRPVSFTYKPEYNIGTGTHLGFVAEEVGKVIPELLTYDEHGVVSGLDYPTVSAVLAKAIQDMNKVIYLGDATTTAPSLYIDSAGRVGIGMGTTTPGYELQVQGDVAAQSFVNISTITSKKDITYVTDTASIYNKLKNIRVANYHYLNEASTDTMHLGLIAEEAPAEVLSESGKGVDIYKLTSFTILAVQDMQKRLDALDARVTKLEAMVAMFGSTTPATASVTPQDTSSSTISVVLNYLSTAAASVKSVFVSDLHVEDQLCVDDVCVTKTQLKALLITAGGTTQNSVPSTPVVPPPVVVPPPTITPPPADDSGTSTPSVATSTPDVAPPSNPSTDSGQATSTPPDSNPSTDSGQATTTTP